MSLGRRIFRIFRAQVGHYMRGAGDRLPGGRPAGDEHDEPSWKSEEDSARTAPKDERAVAAYRLLELPFGSGAEEVRAAHRKLMRRYHPDRFARDPEGLADATRLSQELTAARDLLLSRLQQGRTH